MMSAVVVYLGYKLASVGKELGLSAAQRTQSFDKSMVVYL